MLQPSPTAQAPFKNDTRKNGATQGNLDSFEGYDQHHDMQVGALTIVLVLEEFEVTSVFPLSSHSLPLSKVN